jgi:hypothetical protein
MSRVKNRLNQLREDITAARLNYGGGGGAGISFRLPKVRVGARFKAAGTAAGVAGATVGSVPKPTTSTREKGFASRDFAIKVPTISRSVPVTKATTATATKVATAQPISAPKPKRPKSRRGKTRRMRGAGDGDDENEEQKDTASDSKAAPGTIYSRVADVLRGK